MGRFAHALAAVLSVLGASALTACGGSGGGDGFSQGNGNGQIVLTSIAPNPMQGCGPHAFTITGQNFETVSGTTATVTFRAIAPAGYFPFAAGSSDRASVTATVTSDTTITGFTPPIVICGVAAVTCEIDVMLESGVFATSTGVFTVVINAPTIASITPNPIPAAIPTAFTVTGTGFGPVGGPATVRFTGDNGALLWKDGTKNFADVVGTVVSDTTITGITPIATVCDVDLIGASVQVFFPDGCCTLPTPAGFVSFQAPVITGVSLNPVPAAVQQNGWVINGTNFGPAGTQATVRFIADGTFPLFGDGTQQVIEIPGLIGGVGPAQTLTLTTPLAAVCGIASRGAALRVISPFGSSCDQTAAGFVTFAAPTIVGAQAPIPGAIPTAITITGTNFGPAGSPLIVRFIAANGASIFDDGTSAFEDVPGVVGGTVNTVNVTTPLVTACTAAVNATVRVFAPAGGACVDSAANYLTFNPPTITSMTPNVSNAYPTAPNTAFTITSATATYGPVGSPVEVRFTSANGLNIFGNGSTSEVAVLGTVASATTITGTLPSASLCGVASETVNVRITLQNGSCQTSANLLTYNAPTITTFNGAAAPVVVPSSNPVAITIEGTGFAPLNGVVQVFFVSDPAGPPLFGDGTQRVSPAQPGAVNGAGTQITVIPPHATVSPNTANRSASVQIVLPNGACVTSAAAAITYTAPTLTALAPTGGTLFSATQTGFTITGTNFGPVGSEVAVRFTATSGTPFGNGTQSSFEVPAVVTNATTVTGNASPLAALCGSPAVTVLAGTARVIFQDGSQSSNTAAFTYVAPAITTVTAVGFGPTPVPFTIVGTGFAPVGTIAQVTFTAQGNTPIFTNGSQVETTVTGVVTAANTVTGVTPAAVVCNVTPPAVDVRVTFYGGSCAASVGALTPIAPTITTIAPSSVPATIQTQVTITGTGFGTVGSLAQVVLSISGTPPTSTPFMNASSSEITVTGTVGAGGTTITFFSPLASACTTDVVSDVRVRLSNGSCSLVTPNGLTFVAPTVTTNNLAPATILSLTAGAPNPYTITGTNFAPVGAQVLVRYTATNPIFGDGTSTQIDVSGLVTSNTTITTALPIGRVCAATTAQARVVFPNGACADSPAAFVTWAAPTVTTLSVTNGPAFNPGTTNITGTNFPPTGTPVVLHWSAATPIFAGGTSSTFDQFTTVSAGGVAGAINNVAIPVATTCATTAASLSVEFGNPNAAGCVIAAPQFTYNAPTATLAAATTVDAIGPVAIPAATLAGTNLPPNATVTVRFVATTGTPYEGGSSAAAETVGVVNATGTGIAVANVPGMALCADPSVAPLTATANLSVVLANGCVVAVANPLTYTAPVLTQLNAAAPPLQVAAIAPPAVVTITGTNFGTLPVGTIVTVRLTAQSSIFADGTSNTMDLGGLVAAANTVTFRPPSVTLCGAATVNADLGVLFPGGSCDGILNAITYNAPQVSATPATAFPVQNLAYAGQPFAIVGLGGVNAFGPVGATVNVRFSVAAGTPFQGGTSAFAVVPGTITSATTIVGVAPAVTDAANTIASVSVRAEFEDGSCTNTTTTSYFRTVSRIAVTGGGNIHVLDKAGGGAPTAVAGSPFATAGALGGAFDAHLNRVYVTTGATNTVRYVDLGAGTVAGTPAPVLNGTSITIAGTPTGIAIDTKNHRAWTANVANNTVSVIDLFTNQVIRTFTASVPAGGALTGRIVWDSTNDRMLVPVIVPGAGADQIDIYDATLSGSVGTVLSILNLGVGGNVANTLNWTGGLAVDPNAGLAYLTYDDPDAGDLDAIQALELPQLTVQNNLVNLAAGSNPTAVVNVDPSAGRVFVYMAGLAAVQAFDNDTLVNIGPNLAVAAAPTDLAICSTLNRGYLVLANGTVQAFNTTTNANSGAAVATVGGVNGATTSP